MAYRHELKDVEVNVSATRINNQKEGIGEEIKETGFYPIIIENPPENFVSFGTDEFYGYIIDLDKISNEDAKRGYDYKKYVNALAGQTITFGTEGKDNDVYIYDATGKVFYAKGLYAEGGVYFSDIFTKLGPTVDIEKAPNVATNTVDIVIRVKQSVSNPDGNIIVRVNDTIVNPEADGTYRYTALENGVYVVTAEDDEEGLTKKRVNVTEIIEGEYEIVYHYMDGTTPDKTVIKYGSTPIRLETATREGYLLKGWSKLPAATEPDYAPRTLYKENIGANLYAVWQEGEPREFDVTFIANGGRFEEGIETNLIKIEKTNLVIPSFEPIMENNIFLGWSESSKAEEATYVAGDEYTEERNITLYAVWQKGEIRVDIEISPPGAGVVAGAGIKKDGNIVYITAEANAGYSFYKWTVESNNVRLDNSYAETTRFTMPKGTVKLKAVFKETEYDYKIKYNPNNGSDAPNTQYKKHGEPITLSTMIPKRSAHIFEGWADTVNATVVKYRPGDEYTENKSTTLYAVWTKNTAEATLTFNANGGTNPPAKITTIKGSIIRIPTDTPIRGNLLFLGWSEDNRAKEPTYRKNDYYTITEDKTLYAVWSDSEKPIASISAEEKEGHLVLNGYAIDNGGIVSYAWTNQFYSESEQSAITWIDLDESRGEVIIPKDVIKSGIHCFYVKDENENISHASIEVYKMTFMAENVIIDARYKATGYAASLTDIIPERAMYVFKKWKSDSDGRIFEEGEKYLLNKDELFIATWDEAYAYIPSTNKYYLTLQHAVDATNENATDYTIVQTVRNEVGAGAEIKGNRKISLTTGELTLTAEQTGILIENGSSFKLTDGTITSNEYGIRNNGKFEFEKGKINAPNGIYNTKEVIFGVSSNPFDKDSNVVTSTVASYQIATGATIFFGNGSFVDQKGNDATSAYEVPTSGMTFRNDFELRKINNLTNVATTIVEDLVMTSRVTAGTNARPVEVEVTLSCINNNYTFQYSTNNSNWTTGKKIVLIDNATVYGRILNGSEVMNTEQLTINNIVDLTVKFDARGIHTNPLSKTVKYKRTYGSAVTELSDTTAYYFKGWYTSASGGIRITSSSTVDMTEDHTLYAHWEGKPFTVTFNANGGSTSTSSKTVYYGSTYGSLPTPTRTNYDFLGWYTSTSGGNQKTSSSIVNTDSNHTLYAQWKIKYRYCNCCGGNWYTCSCTSTTCSECGDCTNCCNGHSYCSCCGALDNNCSCYGWCSTCEECTYHCDGHDTGGSSGGDTGGDSGGDSSYDECSCCGADSSVCGCYGSICTICTRCQKCCPTHATVSRCDCCNKTSCSCSSSTCDDCGKCLVHCECPDPICACCGKTNCSSCSSSICPTCNKCTNCCQCTTCWCCSKINCSSCSTSKCSECGKCSSCCGGHVCKTCDGKGGWNEDCGSCEGGSISDTKQCGTCKGSGTVESACVSDNTPTYVPGQGYVYDGCGGDGYFINWCNSCSGNAVVCADCGYPAYACTCSSFNGETCSRCGGGQYENPPTTPCDACGGDGTIEKTCTVCNGNGNTTTSKDCSYCSNGSKWKDCPDC